jgi:hypothetical protein
MPAPVRRKGDGGKYFECLRREASEIDWASLFFDAGCEPEVRLPVKVEFERVMHAGFNVG